MSKKEEKEVMKKVTSDGNVIRQKTFETKKRHRVRKAEVEQRKKMISKRYEGDIRRFLTYCKATDQLDDVEAMLDYLYVSLTEEQIKKTTWERRLAAIKRYLEVNQEIDFKKEHEAMNEISIIRKMYDEVENARLTKIEGKVAVDKSELLKMIDELPTREKAICLVNLITANRPNEMVRLKIKDFHLERRTVSVYLKKQKTWHNKRLTLEATKAVREYIREYKLRPNDYFVGRVYKGGRYESVEISETGYWKALQRWTGLTAYNFRKSQVVSMHEAGADLPTIAKQTGHRSLETISEHYLNVSDTTVDKYL